MIWCRGASDSCAAQNKYRTRHYDGTYIRVWGNVPMLASVRNIVADPSTFSAMIWLCWWWPIASHNCFKPYPIYPRFPGNPNFQTSSCTYLPTRSIVFKPILVMNRCTPLPWHERTNNQTTKETTKHVITQ